MTRRRRDPKTELHEYLAYAARAHGLNWALETELRFHPSRRWRFDYAWPAGKIAVEYDGIMFGDASHSSLAGILRDAEKCNEAQAMGWRVFRANAKTVKDGSFFALIDAVLVEEARVTA